jgi:hypothetical protein
MKCGFTVFLALPESSAGRTERTPAASMPGATPPSPDRFSFRLLGPTPEPAPARKERRRMQRVHPRRLVELHLAPHGLLNVMDISAYGLQIEHERPMRFGETYQAELRYADDRARVRVQVAWSALVPKGERGASAIRYRTGFQFLEPVPPALLATLPRLSEEA